MYPSDIARGALVFCSLAAAAACSRPADDTTCRRELRRAREQSRALELSAKRNRQHSAERDQARRELKEWKSKAVVWPAPLVVASKKPRRWTRIGQYTNIKKAQTEAKLIFARVQGHVRRWYGSDHYGPVGQLLAPAFPPIKSSEWVPKTPCCAHKKGDAARSGRCTVSKEEFEGSPWQTLGFQYSELAKGSYFQMRYRSTGVRADAYYEVVLRGDAGCLGTPVVHTLQGKVDRQEAMLTRLLFDSREATRRTFIPSSPTR